MAPVSADDLARLVMGFDRNSDGALTADELPERFHDMFGRADTDRSGMVTLAELRVLAAAQVQATNARSGAEGRGGRGRRRRGGGGEED